jgi:hypothetical protein
MWRVTNLPQVLVSRTSGKMLLRERRQLWELVELLLLELLGMKLSKPSRAAVMEINMQIAMETKVPLEVVVPLDEITARLVRVIVGAVVEMEATMCKTRATTVDLLDMMMDLLDIGDPRLHIMVDLLDMVEDPRPMMMDLLDTTVALQDTTTPMEDPQGMMIVMEGPQDMTTVTTTAMKEDTMTGKFTFFLASLSIMVLMVSCIAAQRMILKPQMPRVMKLL